MSEVMDKFKIFLQNLLKPSASKVPAVKQIDYRKLLGNWKFSCQAFLENKTVFEQGQYCGANLKYIFDTDRKYTKWDKSECRINRRKWRKNKNLNPSKYIVMFKPYIRFTFDTNSRLKGPLVTYQIDKYQTCNLDSRQVTHTNLNLIHEIYILGCLKNIVDQREDVSNTFPYSECCGSLE